MIDIELQIGPPSGKMMAHNATINRAKGFIHQQMKRYWEEDVAHQRGHSNHKLETGGKR
jgi:hypothetical protein